MIDNHKQKRKKSINSQWSDSYINSLSKKKLSRKVQLTKKIDQNEIIEIGREKKEKKSYLFIFIFRDRTYLNDQHQHITLQPNNNISYVLFLIKAYRFLKSKQYSRQDINTNRIDFNFFFEFIKDLNVSIQIFDFLSV